MNAPDSNDTDPGNAALMPTQYIKSSPMSMAETARRTTAQHVKHHGMGSVDEAGCMNGSWPSGTY